MSTILLREIIEAGFCGMYLPKQAAPTMGQIQYNLDMIIADQKLGMDPIQLANHINLRYEDQIYFQKCLLGIKAQSGTFHPEDVKRFPFKITYDAPVGVLEIRGMVFKDGDAFIEPCYNFYLPDKFVPLHSVIAAYLMGYRGTLRVDVVSALGDSGDALILEVPILENQIRGYLAAIAAKMLAPGGACMNCIREDCTFDSEFEKKVFGWMKAKERVENLDAQIREHLTYRGPTKCGSHLVYMKETARRSFDSSKSMTKFIDELKAEKPVNWQDFLKPDSAEIAKAIKKNHLPKRFLGDYFKLSSSFSIDTTLSL